MLSTLTVQSAAAKETTIHILLALGLHKHVVPEGSLGIASEVTVRALNDCTAALRSENTLVSLLGEIRTLLIAPGVNRVL